MFSSLIAYSNSQALYDTQSVLLALYAGIYKGADINAKFTGGSMCELLELDELEVLLEEELEELLLDELDELEEELLDDELELDELTLLELLIEELLEDELLELELLEVELLVVLTLDEVSLLVSLD